MHTIVRARPSPGRQLHRQHHVQGHAQRPQVRRKAVDCKAKRQPQAERRRAPNQSCAREACYAEPKAASRCESLGSRCTADPGAHARPCVLRLKWTVPGAQSERRRTVVAGVHIAELGRQESRRARPLPHAPRVAELLIAGGRAMQAVSTCCPPAQHWSCTKSDSSVDCATLCACAHRLRGLRVLVIAGNRHAGGGRRR